MGSFTSPSSQSRSSKSGSITRAPKTKPQAAKLGPKAPNAVAKQPSGGF